MMRLLKTGLLVATVGLFSSCMKNDIEDVPPPSTTVPPGLLARIEWDNGLTGYFDYNTDNTLNHIQYNLGGSTGKTMFEWNGGKMISISDDRSQYKNVYVYGGPDSKVQSTENVPKAGTGSVFKLEYTYNAQGRVDSMKYYTTTNGAKVLKSASGYTYDPNGTLTEVITKSGDNLIRSVINVWSQDLSFIPQMYIDVTLSENYDVYNLPVLTQQSKLPAKITRMVKTGSAAYATDKVQEVEFTLEGAKITKTKTSVVYPNLPGTNTVRNANYIYK